MKVVAVIPVKTVSERVESKNFREFFDGKSLFDLLLQKLLDSKEIDEIYISSNSLDLKNKVEKKGCKFIYRDEIYCNNKIPWSDVIAHVADSIPEDNDTSIAWCHTTSPLFDEYDEAVKSYKSLYKEGVFDGLVTVSKLTDFIVSEKKQPINYSWGPWHRYSQDLDTFYSVTGGMFIAPKIEMIRNRYVISKNPNYYIIPPIKAIDIDNEYDFKLAQLLIQNKELLTNA
jgi:CMP-N-acetylneuraminic acid synthetase